MHSLGLVIYQTVPMLTVPSAVPAAQDLHLRTCHITVRQRDPTRGLSTSSWPPAIPVHWELTCLWKKEAPVF